MLVTASRMVPSVTPTAIPTAVPTCGRGVGADPGGSVMLLLLVNAAWLVRDGVLDSLAWVGIWSRLVVACVVVSIAAELLVLVGFVVVVVVVVGGVRVGDVGVVIGCPPHVDSNHDDSNPDDENHEDENHVDSDRFDPSDVGVAVSEVSLTVSDTRSFHTVNELAWGER